jgi:glycosyltransferase involved in cell wall biosynthesis
VTRRTRAPKIVATLLTRDEADVVATTIEHHLAHGVSAIIVTDNASSDATASIVERYPEVVEILREPGRDHDQSRWVTRMARLACRLDPDWIVHLDADELWCGLESLSGVRADVVVSERCYIHPPASAPFDLRSTRHFLDLDRLPLPRDLKVIHRPDPNVVVCHGNRALEGRARGAIASGVRRHHYPIRSVAQWERKARHHEAMQRRGAFCERWSRWHELLQAGKIADAFASLVAAWESFRLDPSDRASLLEVVEHLGTDEVLRIFAERPDLVPGVGEWPAE